MEILSRCLRHKCLLFSTIKERCLYSWKNFCGTPKDREKRESLAQQIFPVYGRWTLGLMTVTLTYLYWVVDINQELCQFEKFS